MNNAILNENGMKLLKPHPYKQIARRLFPMLALLNLCFWSLVAVCNFLFNLSFLNLAYDACLLILLAFAHFIFFDKIIEKLHYLPYKNFTLAAKNENVFPSAFYLKLFLLLFGIVLVSAIAIGSAIYGLAYAIYFHYNSKIGEIDFLLQAWNFIYVLALFGGYISCLISSKILLLPKFNVHAGSVYQKDQETQKEAKVISFPQKGKPE